MLENYINVEGYGLINRQEAVKCLVPFGYRHENGVLQKPSNLSLEDASRTENIEARLRGMKGKTIEERLAEVIVERNYLKIKPSDIEYDTKLEEYGIDSVQTFEIVIGVEDEFGVVAGEDEFDVGNFLTVNAIAEYIRAKWEVKGLEVKKNACNAQK